FNAGPEQAREVGSALEITWLRARDREALWGAERELARALLTKSGELDEEDDRRARPTAPLPAFDRERAERDDLKSAGRRARLALDLLRLAKAPGQEKLEATLARILPEPAQPTTWPAFAQELRQAWAEPTPDPLRAEQVLALWRWLDNRYDCERLDDEGLAAR